MKKYPSSYVLKQIKKKKNFEKKILMDFPYGFSIQLDTRVLTGINQGQLSHRPGIYFLDKISLSDHHVRNISFLHRDREVLWPSGRASDSGAEVGGSILT